LEGTFPSLPLAVTAETGRLLLQFEDGGGGEVGVKPKISISRMLVQSFTLFPLPVILTYLPCVSGKLYFSAAVVVPLLLPEKTLVKVVPSFETPMVKEYCLSFPKCQMISTLRTVFWLPRSS